MTGGFRSVLCVSVFQGSLLVIVIMIDRSEKRNCEGGFCVFVKSTVIRPMQSYYLGLIWTHRLK